VRHRAGGDRSQQKPREDQPQISSERKLPSNPTRGGVEGVEATVLPQASAAEATGAGRNGRAMVVVARVHRGAREGEVRARGRSGSV
jgi:hypothetical protein